MIRKQLFLLLCSKAMEFSLLWLLTHSFFQCFQNCVKACLSKLNTPPPPHSSYIPSLSTCVCAGGEILTTRPLGKLTAGGGVGVGGAMNTVLVFKNK